MQTLTINLTASQIIMLDLMLCAERRELIDKRDEYLNDGNNPEGATPYKNRISKINAVREALNHALNGGE